MSLLKVPVYALLSAICLFSFLTTAQAQSHSCGTPRQYYSEWKQHPTENYHYRSYYYKPQEKYSGYKHHYVVYTPQKPDHYYYYNPYKKQYWGRCPVNHGGQPLYSHLPVEFMKPTLAEIPEDAFPAFGALPPIPESTDGPLLDLPPDDLPVLSPGL